MDDILNALIGLLNEALEYGFSKLEPARQADVLFSLPVLYSALETYGDKFVASTANPFDDKAVIELKEACLNIDSEFGSGIVTELKAVFDEHDA